MTPTPERRMIDKYWPKQEKGTIVYEYPIVQRSTGVGARRLDALILPNRETRVAQPSEIPLESLEGQHLIIVQAKHRRLGMAVMGQAVFSVELVRRFKPASIRSIVLCTDDDEILRPLLSRYSEVEVVMIKV